MLKCALAVSLADFVNRNNGRMIQAGGRFRFAETASRALLAH
jgi:hypothetical protein